MAADVRDFLTLPGDKIIAKHAEPLDGPGEFALAGKDGRRVGELLRAAEKRGREAFARLTEQAVRRLLADPQPATAPVLFTDAELDELKKVIAATTSTADLLGRARVQRLAANARERAGVQRFAEPLDYVHDYTKDSCPECGGKVVAACRCRLNDRRCASGHHWRRADDGSGLMLEDPHGEPVRVVPPPAETFAEWQGPFRGERGGTYWLRSGAQDTPENRVYAGSKESADHGPAGDPEGEPSGERDGTAILYDPADRYSDSRATARTVFGRDLPNAHLAAIASAASGSSTRVIAESANEITLRTTGPLYKGWVIRSVVRQKDGTLACENHEFKLNDKGTGLGTILFAEQVRGLRAAGVSQIRTFAAGDPEVGRNFNGFYTWPMLGYDGVVPEYVWKKMPPELQSAAGDARSVLSVVQAPGGAAWWKKNGGEFQGTFDLRAGSRSMWQLAAYIRKRKADGRFSEGGTGEGIPHDQSSHVGREGRGAGAGPGGLGGASTNHGTGRGVRGGAGRGVGRFAEPDFDAFSVFDDSPDVDSPEAAVDWFRTRVNTLDLHPERYAPRAYRQAAIVATAADEVLLQRIKDVIAKKLATGQGGPADVQELLDAAGVSTRNPRYADDVMRTNLTTAYAEGQDAEMSTPTMQEMFPAWTWHTIVDGRERDTHRARDGRLYPASARFTDVRGHSAEEVICCRCGHSPVSKFDLERLIRQGHRVEESW